MSSLLSYTSARFLPSIDRIISRNIHNICQSGNTQMNSFGRKKTSLAAFSANFQNLSLNHAAPYTVCATLHARAATISPKTSGPKSSKSAKTKPLPDLSSAAPKTSSPAPAPAKDSLYKFVENKVLSSPAPKASPSASKATPKKQPSRKASTQSKKKVEAATPLVTPAKRGRPKKYRKYTTPLNAQPSKTKSVSKEAKSPPASLSTTSKTDKKPKAKARKASEQCKHPQLIQRRFFSMSTDRLAQNKGNESTITTKPKAKKVKPNKNFSTKSTKSNIALDPAILNMNDSPGLFLRPQKSKAVSQSIVKKSKKAQPKAEKTITSLHEKKDRAVHVNTSKISAKTTHATKVPLFPITSEDASSFHVNLKRESLWDKLKNLMRPEPADKYGPDGNYTGWAGTNTPDVKNSNSGQAANTPSEHGESFLHKAPKQKAKNQVRISGIMPNSNRLSRHNHTESSPRDNFNSAPNGKVSSVSESEIRHFDRQAKDWWTGENKSLEKMNDVRIPFIRENLLPPEICYSYLKPYDMFNGLKFLDMGCGGGFLAEPLAKLGADVTGVDASKENIKTAKAHMKQNSISSKSLRYEVGLAEDISIRDRGQYDVVTCMEVIEHVENPEEFLRCLFRLLKPGGSIFLSTMNRRLAANVIAIQLGENILRHVTKGTHQYEKFVKPSELKKWVGKMGHELKQIQSVYYMPVVDKWHVSKIQTENPLCNYMAWLKKSS